MSIKESDLLKIIQKLRKSTIGMIIWIFLSFIVLYYMGGNECVKGVSVVQRIIETVVALLFTLIVHELIHASVMKVFNKGEVKIKLIKMEVGGFGLVTILNGELKNWQQFIMYILPFILLTVIPAIFIIQWKCLFLYLIALINCAGSYFDLLDAILILQ